MLKVFGHLNPDTDSTAAAIVYSWFLEQTGHSAKPYLLGEPNKEALFVLDHFSLKAPELLEDVQEGEEVVIVDTNNPDELPKSIDKATIREIVDHHKLVGGLSTPDPIRLTMRPVACTMTVIWEIMQRQKITDLPEDIAGLMLAAILSDTLKFTSPTTTPEDKDVAEKLAAIAKLDIEEFAADMFSAKSDLTGMSTKDILLSDSKIFPMGDKKIRVSVLETTDIKPALSMESAILQAIEDMKKEESLDGLFFFIVDILNSASTLILSTEYEKEIAEKAFGAAAVNNSMELPGIVSRKKQMVPSLEGVIR
jgi:manganese-dependent inorganic pyrophosphatase